MSLQVVHGNTLVDLLRIVERLVQIVVHEGEYQLAEDRIEQRVAGHRIRDGQQSLLQGLVVVHQLLADVVGDDLAMTPPMKPDLAVEGIGG